MPKEMGVDIETFSSVDIDCGPRPYSEAPDFQILLIGYNIDGGPVKQIDLSGCFPPTVEADQVGDLYEFEKLLLDPAVTKTAFNAAFERTCLAKWSRQPMPAEQWRCTMVLSYNAGLPGKLAEVGPILGLDRQKMAEGKNLIPFFCSPCKPTKANGGRTRNLPGDAPEKWADFCRYNIRDVEVENDIKQHLAHYYIPDVERKAWCMDQEINERGVFLDAGLISNAIRCGAAYNVRLSKEFEELTHLSNPNSDVQLKAWIQQLEGVEIKSLRKEFIPEVIEQLSLPETRRAIEIRSELKKTSNSKYDAMQRATCADGRARNMLQFYGANRTGRWAGRIVQVQNLPQNHIEDLDLAHDLLQQGDFELLEMCYGKVPFILSQLIRTAFIPTPGNRFLVADFSAIEARVVAWLAGEKWALDEFRGDGLIYEATASAMYHVPKLDIKKGGPRSDLRPRGKTATLACGYQGGPAALIRMGALRDGIPEDELPGIVARWRKANRHIVQFWSTVEDAAINACQGSPVEIQHGIKFFRDQESLYIRLPSGRRLAYFHPELQPEPKFNKEGVTYMGVDSTSKQKIWGRVKTYGGRITENIVQATARDALRDTMLRVEAAGYKIVFHVHDEMIIDCPKDRGSLDEILQIMARPLDWAPGLPLCGAGFEADYYQKD